MTFPRRNNPAARLSQVLTSLDLSCNAITDDSTPAVSLVPARAVFSPLLERLPSPCQVLSQSESALEYLALSMNLIRRSLSLSESTQSFEKRKTTHISFGPGSYGISQLMDGVRLA